MAQSTPLSTRPSFLLLNYMPTCRRASSNPRTKKESTAFWNLARLPAAPALRLRVPCTGEYLHYSRTARPNPCLFVVYFVFFLMCGERVRRRTTVAPRQHENTSAASLRVAVRIGGGGFSPSHPRDRTAPSLRLFTGHGHQASSSHPSHKTKRKKDGSPVCLSLF